MVLKGSVKCISRTDVENIRCVTCTFVTFYHFSNFAAGMTPSMAVGHFQHQFSVSERCINSVSWHSYMSTCHCASDFI